MRKILDCRGIKVINDDLVGGGLYEWALQHSRENRGSKKIILKYSQNPNNEHPKSGFTRILIKSDIQMANGLEMSLFHE